MITSFVDLRERFTKIAGARHGAQRRVNLRNVSLSRRVLAFVALTCFALLMLEGNHAWQNRDSQLREEQSTNVNLARALIQHAEDTIIIADGLLVSLVQHFEQEDMSPTNLAALKRQMTTRAAESRRFINLLVLNEGGELLFSSTPGSQPRQNHADRAFFQHHRVSPDRSIFVGEAIRSHVREAWVMTVSRRLQHSDGRFAGVAVAGIDVEVFSKHYAGIDDRPGSTVTLLHARGSLLSRYPFDAAQIGFDSSRGELFRKHLPYRESGSYRFVSTIDRIDKVGGFDSGRSFPLVIVVATAVEQALADWRAETAMRLGGVSVAVALLAWLGAWLVQQIRQRQRAERALGASAGKLERLVRHLDRARTRADQASQAKSRFLASMSHELRTPLNGILGYAQILKLEGGLASQQERRVEAMLEAGQHLLDMINRVLDLSEIEAGRIDLHLTAFDPCELAKACLDQVRPIAEARAITLHLVTAPDITRLIATDATRLRQVLLNLLGNAVKFTAQGAVELRLRLINEDRIRVEVADTGPGVPVGKREQLFQDFERLGAEGITIEGAGLGLAISARLTRLMGGRIGHEDNPGGGSVFWLELPQGEAPSLALAAPPDVQAPTSPLARSLRLLVVDDVAMNRDVAGSFLRAASHDIASAESGAQAVELAATKDFDLILMDVRMPEMDGLEATRRIRALAGARGRVPIVALTAQAFVEQIAECRSVGMNTHLAKPFTQAALLDAVARAVATDADSIEADPMVPKVASASVAVASRAASEAGSDLPIFSLVAFERTAVFLPPAAIADYLQILDVRIKALLEQLREHDALARDASGLAEAAHALAGSAGMFGFERIAAVARLFENAAQKASPETQALARQLVLALEISLDIVQQRAALCSAQGL